MARWGAERNKSNRKSEVTFQKNLKRKTGLEKNLSNFSSVGQCRDYHKNFSKNNLANVSNNLV